MGQIEIYDWLKAQNGGKFFSPKEVFKGMIRDGLLSENSNKFRNGNISGALALLEAQGYLQVKIIGDTWWSMHRKYRIKKV